VEASRQWLHRHEDRLWWLHSAWALAFGVGVMWLGARDFRYLRLAFAQVAFIWVTSLLLPRVARWAHLGPTGLGRVRLVVNYFHKNFYQQVLFFVLPVYWASVTLSSVNVLFVLLVAGSAVLSTFDVVYDRHVSARADLASVFFGFNLFVCANVALPVLWTVSNATAMRLAALLAVLGFATIRFTPSQLRRRAVLAAIVLIAVVLGGLLESGRRLVPPAPLRMVDASFGGGVDRRTLALADPLVTVPAGWSGTLHALTAVKAPLGLKDRVRHRWVVGGTEVRVTPFYTVAGGRESGFRLWTAIPVQNARSGTPIQVDVETEGGQLIGRARTKVE
jgi:hypothetical protein